TAGDGWRSSGMSRRSAATSQRPAATSGSPGRPTTSCCAAIRPKASKACAPGLSVPGPARTPHIPRWSANYLPAAELPLRPAEDLHVPQALPRRADLQLWRVAHPAPPRDGPATRLAALQTPRPALETVRETTARPPSANRRQIPGPTARRPQALLPVH